MTSPIFRSFHWITYCGTNWQQHSIYTYFHLSWHGIEIVSALQTTCRGNPSVTYESQPPTPSPPPAHKGSAVRNFYISNQPVLPIAVMLKWRRCSVLPSGPAICRLLVWCKILHHLARQGGWRSWCRGWWGRCRGRWQWRTRPEERDTRGPIYWHHLPLGKMAANLTDNIFKCIFINESFCISFRISVKFVTRGPINNRLTLVQVMAWRQAITLTNADPIHWRTNAALGGDEIILITSINR